MDDPNLSKYPHEVHTQSYFSHVLSLPHLSPSFPNMPIFTAALGSVSGIASLIHLLTGDPTSLSLITTINLHHLLQCRLSQTLVSISPIVAGIQPSEGTHFTPLRSRYPAMRILKRPTEPLKTRLFRLRMSDKDGCVFILS